MDISKEEPFVEGTWPADVGNAIDSYDRTLDQAPWRCYGIGNNG
jgi:hypothetical protein